MGERWGKRAASRDSKDRIPSGRFAGLHGAGRVLWEMGRKEAERSLKGEIQELNLERLVGLHPEGAAGVSQTKASARVRHQRERQHGSKREN